MVAAAKGTIVRAAFIFCLAVVITANARFDITLQRAAPRCSNATGDSRRARQSSSFRGNVMSRTAVR